MNGIPSLRTGAAGGVSDIDLGPNGSVQIMFAKLQLMMSGQCKAQAESKMQEIESIQNDQRKLAEVMEEARKLQAEAAKNGKCEPSEAFIKFCKEHGIEVPTNAQKLQYFATGSLKAIIIQELRHAGYSGDDRRFMEELLHRNGPITQEEADKLKAMVKNTTHNTINDSDFSIKTIKCCTKDDMDFCLKSLSNYQQTVGNKTQTLMVYLQDFIGQYNSFLQGASSTINDAKNVLASIAKGQ